MDDRTRLKKPSKREPKYTCCICWRRTPWSKGCADDADEVCCQANVRKTLTTDTGICDDCWCALGGADMIASVVADAADYR